MRKRKTPTALALLSCLLLSGCLSIEPTYTKEKIVEHITTLCQKEYQVAPRVWLLGETVWVYIPLPRLISKDIQWDKEMLDRINKVMMGASRVLLSMKPRPQFLVMVASDTQEYGIDYTAITWIPDIVKFQLEFISRDEFSRRNIIQIKENISAISDTEGNHIEKKEIKMPDFLAEQIAQRIRLKFMQEPEFKDYFKLTSASAVFVGDTFKINTDITQIKTPPKPIDIQREILKIVAYVIKEYDFKDFLLAEVENVASGEKSLFSRLALKKFLK